MIKNSDTEKYIAYRINMTRSEIISFLHFTSIFLSHSKIRIHQKKFHGDLRMIDDGYQIPSGAPHGVYTPNYNYNNVATSGF